jgi:carboxypeptidase Taq
MGLGAAMHEVGHALYELGIPRDEQGTGVDGPASLGVHESQSRFWENAIGGSRAFCDWVAGPAGDHLGADAPTGEALYRAVNRVKPGLIRILSDEVTYNLHIIIRFELEYALMDGSLSVADLPAAWDAAYRDTLGVQVPDLKSGVLQDMHWSSGSFGYFPTYTLGNLYAAALLGRMEAELPTLWEDVGRGSLNGVLDWLRERIHQHGAVHDGCDLVRSVVGDVDLVETLLGTLWDRHGVLYGVSR